MVFYGKSLQECYIDVDGDLPDLVICVTAIYADDATLNSTLGFWVVGFVTVGFWTWIAPTRHYGLKYEVANKIN